MRPPDDDIALEIQLTFHRKAPQPGYDVRVESSHSSAEIAAWEPPVAGWELERIAELSQGGRGKPSVKRSAAAEPWDRMADLGARLFRSVFTGRAAALYQQVVEVNGTGLSVRIVSSDHDILGLPWEALYDSAGRQDFLALASGWSIVRAREDVARAMPPATPRMRVLLVVGAEANHIGEVDDLLRRLARENENLLVEPIREASHDGLRSRLAEEPPVDVLHFWCSADGSGARQALLLSPALEDRLGNEELQRLLQAPAAPRTVVLSACPSDRIAADLAWTVPVTVGIRGMVTVRGRLGLAEGFYRSIAAGSTLNEASWAGRSLADRAVPGLRDWTAMVVYSAQDGRLVTAPEPEARRNSVLLPGPPPSAGHTSASGQAAILKMRRTVAARNLAAIEERAARLHDALPKLVNDQIAALREEIARLDAQFPGGSP